MFFYLSFIRPPPTKAPVNNTLLITPQIANDLRTESCTTDHELFYDWVRVEDGADIQTRAAVHARRASAKKPTMTKLTTWKAANAYKEVPVPLPPSVREGQMYKLVLAAVPIGPVGPNASAPANTLPPSTGRILLDDERLGRWHPLSVSSMPVLFTYQSRGAPKQEEIERTYEFRITGADAEASASANLTLEEISTQLKGLQLEVPKDCAPGKSRDVRLVIREQTSFDLDKKIWDSGIGMSAWLVQWLNRRFPAPRAAQKGNVAVGEAATRLKDILNSPDAINVLELGAGVGIVALVLAALRSRLANADDKILTTDLESALPLLNHTIEFNASAISPRISVKTGVLDWDESLAEQLPEQESFDLVVMADVAYNHDSFSSLVKILSGLQTMDPAKRPCFVLGYKERDAAERTLWELTEAVGIKFVQIGSVPGHAAGDAPVEIWVAQS
ncbi:putative methyltransferase-domain-containing protein [Ephemerocybe angulata]|uniref:Putative methyltransferase-domain-containing protein n=1 Tax=Ephemerocybe angulata TaxID=980116 RepID=A0A8H6HWG3_9AGAR|nr:putative methyltransferase-domain-containing protein [Tulosesus angulatus]